MTKETAEIEPTPILPPAMTTAARWVSIIGVPSVMVLVFLFAVYIPDQDFSRRQQERTVQTLEKLAEGYFLQTEIMRSVNQQQAASVIEDQKQTAILAEIRDEQRRSKGM